MFEDNFPEYHEKIATLEEIEGVVSVRSVEAFLQWLYHQTVTFDEQDPKGQISAAIELARLADMCNVTELESQMARFIRELLIANYKVSYNNVRKSDRYSDYLKPQHIVSASFLPQSHAVRRLLVAACVEAFLAEGDFEYSQVFKEYPALAIDLLEELRSTLGGLKGAHNVIFTEPINGRRIQWI